MANEIKIFENPSFGGIRIQEAARRNDTGKHRKNHSDYNYYTRHTPYAVRCSIEYCYGKN